jgi:hypothetical protein
LVARLRGKENSRRLASDVGRGGVDRKRLTFAQIGEATAVEAGEPMIARACTPSSAPCRTVKFCFLPRQHYRE